MNNIITKIVTKFMGFMLCLVMAFSLMPVAEIAAATIDYPECTMYAHSTDGSVKGWTGVDVGELVTPKKCKSTNSSVASVGGYNAYEATDYYYRADEKKFESITNKTINVSVTIKKAGKATVSFKAGKDTYKLKVNVLKYTNPLKLLKVSGVEGGKDIASKYKKADTKEFKALKKTVKEGKITVKASKGWHITYISYNEYKANKKTITDQVIKSKSYGGSPTSATFNIGKMNKDRDGYASVTLSNDENGLPIEIYVNLNR